MMEQKQEYWFLDKRVPMGLILAIVLQTALGLVWAGQFVQRLAVLEQRTEFMDGTNERIARLEENTRHMRTTLERLEYKIDHLKIKKGETKWR